MGIQEDAPVQGCCALKNTVPSGLWGCQEFLYFSKWGRGRTTWLPWRLPGNITGICLAHLKGREGDYESLTWNLFYKNNFRESEVLLHLNLKKKKTALPLCCLPSLCTGLIPSGSQKLDMPFVLSFSSNFWCLSGWSISFLWHYLDRTFKKYLVTFISHAIKYYLLHSVCFCEWAMMRMESRPQKRKTLNFPTWPNLWGLPEAIIPSTGFSL